MSANDFLISLDGIFLLTNLEMSFCCPYIIYIHYIYRKKFITTTLKIKSV